MSAELNYFVPFLLYRVMARGIRQATADYAKLDLAIQEARVLIALLQHGGSLRAGSLADITCIEASALSHILKRLTRRGFIRRDRVQSDNRAVDVTFTEAGRKTARMCSRLSNKHEGVLLKQFSARERDLLRGFLDRMNENASEWATAADAMMLLKPAARTPSRARARRPRPSAAGAADADA